MLPLYALIRRCAATFHFAYAPRRRRCRAGAVAGAMRRYVAFDARRHYAATLPPR